MGFSDILNNADSENKTQDLKTDPVFPSSDDDPLQNQDGAILPPQFFQTIENIIINWCNDNNIDDMSKAAALQWRACCLYIGQYIKSNNIIVDKERTAREGGRVYSVNALLELVDIWEYCCTKYRKIPLATDFIAFSGVSHNYFYGGSGGKVTTAGGVIWKKVSDIQQGGIASGIVDGRENPTGKIYFSKAVLGWSEDGRRRDDLQGQNENLQSFPDLAGLLPKKDG